jgi:two-component system sensor histidine kinase CpxA
VDPAHLGYVADAQEEVRVMSQMVEELLAFAKAGMRTTELKLVSVPLLPLVRRICTREAATCEVKIDIAESTAALAQPALLARALANVLRNAARYARTGGPITIAAQHQHDAIKLTIADHGPGVPPDSLNRLFDPFYRLEPDRARATGGTGLGLAIAKTCIEACHGTVAARNLSPSGLEIGITLPADDSS